MSSIFPCRHLSAALGSLALACGVIGAAHAQAPTPPALEFVFELRAEVADPLVVGELPTGQTRRIIDILGGTFEGPKIRGRLRPGGADWQLIRRGDGFTEVDARYTLETESGQLIYVTNVGMRHAAPEVMRRLNAGEVVDQSEIYFRAVPKFENGRPRARVADALGFRRHRRALSERCAHPLLAGSLAFHLRHDDARRSHDRRRAAIAALRREASMARDVHSPAGQFLTTAEVFEMAKSVGKSRSRRVSARSQSQSRRKTVSKRNGNGGSRKDAVAVLKADHREVEGLFKQFEKSRSDERKSEIAARICTALKTHTTIEEEIFYPAFLEATEEKDLHHEAEVEHEGAKNLIAQIESAGPSDEYYDAKVTVLKEMIKHHVKEEEQPGGMFAKARRSEMDLRAAR